MNGAIYMVYVVLHMVSLSSGLASICKGARLHGNCASLRYSLAVLVVGVAWFRYRPYLALITVGIASLPFIITRVLKKQKSS